MRGGDAVNPGKLGAAIFCLVHRRPFLTRSVTMKYVLAILLAIVLAGCVPFWTGGEKTETYIVGFSEELGESIEILANEGLIPSDIFPVVDGVAVDLTEDQAEWVEKNLPVRFIEREVLHSIPPEVEVWPVGTTDIDEIGWELKAVNAVSAWYYTKGKGVNIGVIDTGIDATHLDLVDAVIGGYNGITGSDVGWQDDQGHGTSVAGAIAGRYNGSGIAGVAPRASLYSLKGLDKNGRGKTTWLLRCFQKALDLELDMVNCSWGASVESMAIRDAMENLAAWQGMGVVCAAGNDGRSPIIYPARNAVAVCVTAIDTNKQLASFSSYGYAVKQNGVAAPGEWVLAAKMGGGTRRVSGTSIATPYVTGLLALTKAMYNPGRRWVFAGASQPDPDIYLGHGIIDCRKTLDAILEASK